MNSARLSGTYRYALDAGVFTHGFRQRSRPSRSRHEPNCCSMWITFRTGSHSRTGRPVAGVQPLDEAADLLGGRRRALVFVLAPLDPRLAAVLGRLQHGDGVVGQAQDVGVLEGLVEHRLRGPDGELQLL